MLGTKFTAVRPNGADLYAHLGTSSNTGFLAQSPVPEHTLSLLSVLLKEWFANSSPYFGPSAGGMTITFLPNLANSWEVLATKIPSNLQCQTRLRTILSFLSPFRFAPSITCRLNHRIPETRTVAILPIHLHASISAVPVPIFSLSNVPMKPLPSPPVGPCSSLYYCRASSTQLTFRRRSIMPIFNYEFSSGLVNRTFQWNDTAAPSLRFSLGNDGTEREAAFCLRIC